MELYLNSIFYAKKGFQISTADAVAAALIKLPSIQSNVLLTAEDAYVHCLSVCEGLKSEPCVTDQKQDGIKVSLEEAVVWLTKTCENPEQRNVFISELNKFRSKKVSLSGNFKFII